MLEGALEATVRYEDGRFPYDAAAEIVPGEVVARPDGSLAVYDGLDKAVSGDPINPAPLQPAPIIEVVADTADTWSAGTDLYWDATANDVTTTATNNVWLGRSVTDKTAGMVSILINPGNDRPSV
jgi:hypothetical protein